MPAPDPDVEVTTGCRSCGAAAVERILSLGRTPLADGLLTPEELHSGEERRFPLEVAMCTSCSLVQLLHSVSPDLLFGRDYPYYSSFSEEVLENARRHAMRLIERRLLGPSSLVVELASNDGYLLRNFVEAGVPALGIDPAEGPASVARGLGIPTLTEFFGLELARKLLDQGNRADVIVANNVLAHVRDLNGFVAGIALLLADDGIAVFEVPYVRDLIERREFDTIYHEHLCYFSVTALQVLMRRHCLELIDIERLSIHGGSLRVTVGRDERASPVVTEMLAAEADAGMHRSAYYRGFADEVRAVRRELRRLLDRVKSEGGRVAAYGAAAKGSTLLNYAGIGPDVIDFVVDRNVHKQGKFMPGVHLPIRAPDVLLREMPTHVLLLAWNFRDEIVRQQAEYVERGGRFIVPIPEPAIL